jgi:hypothetical protein
MQIVKSWGYNVKEITGLWVNENWQVEMIEQMLL